MRRPEQRRAPARYFPQCGVYIHSIDVCIHGMHIYLGVSMTTLTGGSTGNVQAVSLLAKLKHIL